LFHIANNATGKLQKSQDIFIIKEKINKK